MQDGWEAAAEEEPEAAPPRVLAAMAGLLGRLVVRNERVGAVEEGRRGLAAFRGVRAPSIGIGKYLERIYRYTGCSPACFVLGFVYVDRAAHLHPASLVVSLNVHRLLLTSLLVASKFLDDFHHNNAFFARVGGVSNIELNQLELELLSLLDFKVMVDSRTFENYCLHLEKEMMWNGANIEKIDKSICDHVDGEFAVIRTRNSSMSPLVDTSATVKMETL